jgi:hypothetical protein
MIGLLIIAFGFVALVAFAALALRFGVDSRVDAIDPHRVDQRVSIS